MAGDALRVAGWRNKCARFSARPEWASAYHAQIAEAANPDPRTMPLAAARDQ